MIMNDQTDNSNKQAPDELEIDDLFGQIFGIERVHILKKSDALISVIEKITIVPENKLVFIEEN